MGVGVGRGGGPQAWQTCVLIYRTVTSWLRDQTQVTLSEPQPLPCLANANHLCRVLDPCHLVSVVEATFRGYVPYIKCQSPLGVFCLCHLSSQCVTNLQARHLEAREGISSHTSSLHPCVVSLELEAISLSQMILEQISCRLSDLLVISILLGKEGTESGSGSP